MIIATTVPEIDHCDHCAAGEIITVLVLFLLKFYEEVAGHGQ